MTEKPKKQVDAIFYTFAHYHDIERWCSYYYQISEVLAFTPSSVLEIGVGAGIIKDVLKKEGIAYKSLDIAEDLHPDLVGSVDAIPLPDKSVDVVCAFEVLEHLPYDHFEGAIRELTRVAKSGIVVSLPHFGPPVKFLVKIPFMRQLRFAIKIPWARQHRFNGQHYWEIGKRGYSVSKICSVLEKHADIVREYVPFENQYHHFFVLRKKHEASL